ncbi:YciI family protein [Cryptosporangium phraense]|uniref:Transcription initiation protein n=1 Tax=Cryptosporangium phraense TaxID=2593070 RepID=A0A545AV27_9ACTN|nr:YciI family protein [Cryptosporangium phraense]TQS45189.1 transcription initiation protein [Cryptosporangium phraense]
MKYVLLICDDESVLPTNEDLATDPQHQAWVDALSAHHGTGRGARLRPTSEATTVRVRNAETLVSDGPFAETKDFVGGFAIVDCDTLDEAVALAAKHPYAQWGSVEIRPMWE